MWDIYYLDVMGNGFDEAVLVNQYGIDWHPYIEVIARTNRGLERIPANIAGGKYGSLPEVGDGFFAVTTNTGGSGEQIASLTLYVYDEGRLISVLEDLFIYHSVSFPQFPDSDFTMVGEIVGRLTEFMYRAVKHNHETDEETIETIAYYTYNPGDRSFETQVIVGEAPSTPTTQATPQTFYEMNQDYEFDLDRSGRPDTFVVYADEHGVEVEVNGQRFPWN